MKIICVTATLIISAVIFSAFVSCRHDVAAPTTESPMGTSSDSLHQDKYGRKLVFYAEVDKAGDYFRRMLIDSASAAAVASSGSLPANALLYLETWFGANQSTVYIRQKVNGRWLSNSFSPSSPDYNVVLTNSCNNCHATASVTDDTYTLPLLRKALQRKSVQRIICDQPSFTPCDLQVYQGN
jgi:hypothetical protein